MTPGERSHPEVINGSRRQRIARGSGTSVQDVNRLLKQYAQLRKMMKQFKGMEGKLPRMKNFPGLPDAEGVTNVAVTIRLRRMGIDEATGLSRGRGGLALAARRPLHRDARALQPADRAADGDDRPGEGRGVDQEGRPAVEHGAEADGERAGAGGAGGEVGDHGADPVRERPDIASTSR